MDRFIDELPEFVWHHRQRIAVLCLLVLCALIAPWVFCSAAAVVVTVIVLKTSPAMNRRSECARLIADCDAQHDAWKRQDDMTAFFGRYQPVVGWQFGGRPTFGEWIAPVGLLPDDGEDFWVDPGHDDVGPPFGKASGGVMTVGA